MRTAVYVRVSTEDQSVSMQLHAISSFMQLKGIPMYCLYQDEGYSGATDDRPALKQLKNDLNQGHIEFLVIWKLDRLFRNLSKLLAFVESLKEQNVKFASVQDNIDMSTPIGMCYMGIFGSIAQFERETIRERVIAGIKAAKARNVKFGPHIKIGNEIKTKAKELRQTGMTYKLIANELKISESMAYKIIKGV